MMEVITCFIYEEEERIQVQLPRMNSSIGIINLMPETRFPEFLFSCLLNTPFSCIAFLFNSDF